MRRGSGLKSLSPRSNVRPWSPILLVACASLGCQEFPPDAVAQGGPSPEVVSVMRELASSFVVFESRTLEVERLGEPMAIPVLAGSRPSPQTLWSDAPDIVSVQPDGGLVAHRAGRALLHARNGGPPLLVVVQERSLAPPATESADDPPPRGLRVNPARVRLRLGEAQAFEALTPDGPVPGEWTTSNGQKLVHLQDHIFQGLELGSAQVCARAGNQRACSSVEVTP